MARLPRLKAGSTFGDDFRVVELLGQGSMGNVYEVERISDGRRLALKLVDVSGSRDPRAERRFEREVAAGMSIQSEHVARAVAAGNDAQRGLAWVVMEIVRGVELKDYVSARAPLSRAAARELLAQLYDAMVQVHGCGLIHRDLKPDNVRVEEHDGTTRLKVLDFGIAKSFGGPELSKTEPGLGTPLWMAPEQGKQTYELGPRVDVWALGLLTFFVLTGKLYWRHTGPDATLADLALEVVRSPIEPASERAALFGVERLLPDGFDDWFARAVNRDPEARFADAREAWRALEPLLAEDAAGHAPSRERGRPVRRTGTLLAALIAGCFAMGYAIYWLITSSRY